jgi:DNA-binding response OmpR family regulator
MPVADHSLLKTTILLLVADSVVRSILKETFQREGYTVMATGDLGDAVDRLSQCVPGHEAAMYLRTKCQAMRVLMLGGLLDDERLQYRAAQQGFEVFPKPYTAAALLEEVRQVLRKPRG